MKVLWQKLVRLYYYYRPVVVKLVANGWFAGCFSSAYTVFLFYAEIKSDAWTSNNWKYFIGLVACAPPVGYAVLAIFKSSSPVNSPENALIVHQNFISVVGGIVKAKIDRFNEKARGIKRKEDKFSVITKPKDQIGVISNAVDRFLRDNFSIQEEQINITILGKTPTGSWKWVHSHQNWMDQLSAPREIVEKGSAAHKAITTANIHFFPSKFSAAARNEYRKSDRDTIKGDGSIFIKPVTVTTRKGKFQYVISISTYGICLANELDEQTCLTTSKMLAEISRRFELEIYLLTIDSV